MKRDAKETISAHATARAPCPSTSKVSTDNRVINANAALMDDAFGREENKKEGEDKIFPLRSRAGT